MLKISNFLLFGEIWTKIFAKYYREILLKVNTFLLFNEAVQHSWLFLSSHKHSLLHGPSSWVFMASPIHFSWAIMGTHEHSLAFMGTNKQPRAAMSVHDCQWALMSSHKQSCSWSTLPWYRPRPDPTYNMFFSLGLSWVWQEMLEMLKQNNCFIWIATSLYPNLCKVPWNYNCSNCCNFDDC